MTSGSASFGATVLVVGAAGYACGVAYDVASGTLSELRQDQGFASACLLASSSSAAEGNDVRVPAPGDAFTGWWPPSGAGMAGGRCGSRVRSTRGRCS